MVRYAVYTRALELPIVCQGRHVCQPLPHHPTFLDPH